MEDPLGTAPQKIRRRVKIKQTLPQRIKKVLSMPHLKRRERNQRVAIGAVVLMLGLYLAIVRPIIDYFFPYVPPKKTQSLTPPAKTGLQKNR